MFNKPKKMIAGWFRSRRRKDVKSQKSVSGLSEPISNYELLTIQRQLHIGRSEVRMILSFFKTNLTIGESNQIRVNEIIQRTTKWWLCQVQTANTITSNIDWKVILVFLNGYRKPLSIVVIFISVWTCSNKVQSYYRKFSDDDSVDVLNITPEKELDMINSEKREEDHNAYVPVREPEPKVPNVPYYPIHPPPLPQPQQTPYSMYMWQQYQIQQHALYELQRRFGHNRLSWWRKSQSPLCDSERQKLVNRIEIC